MIDLYQQLFRNSVRLFVLCILLQATACEKFNKDASARALPASGKGSSELATSSHPNIILVLGDDIGYEIPAYTGGQSYQTPNLDHMAQQGMQFTQCYGLPMCTPSRFEVLTGKYNNRNYSDYSWGHMDVSQRTIANMLHDAGYATCIAGKWQLDGGDNSIHTFGFDTYSVSIPFKQKKFHDDELDLYKNPKIYQKGNYLPAADMQGKYGEDVNRNFLFRFIDSMKNTPTPFFAMWTPNLCHAPFQPTPDDPEFASFDPSQPTSDGDTVYFPSMVKYFDKEMGMLMNKLQNAGIESNTIVLCIIGDNGTDGRIVSRYNNSSFRGGKGKTADKGIHLPMIAYGPAKIMGGKVNNNLVDFTDILPTLADIADIPAPANFGILDGVSFAPQLFGQFYTARTSCFGYYDVNRNGPDDIPPSIFSFDVTYKEYKDSASYRMYNHQTDPAEKKVIKPKNMTKAQHKKDSTLKAVINYYLQ